MKFKSFVDIDIKVEGCKELIIEIIYCCKWCYIFNYCGYSENYSLLNL